MPKPNIFGASVYDVEFTFEKLEPKTKQTSKQTNKKPFYFGARKTRLSFSFSKRKPAFQKFCDWKQQPLPECAHVGS